MTEETAVPAEADAEATSAGEDRSTASGTAIARPDNLPDKFWDAAAGAVRMDELVKSYRELENQFARRPVNDSTPIDSAEDYAIDVSGPVDVDLVVNGLLFEAGLNNDQVQVVYDLANRFFGEVAERVKTEAMLDHRAEMLERHFGGREKWSRARDQIRTSGSPLAEGCCRSTGLFLQRRSYPPTPDGAGGTRRFDGCRRGRATLDGEKTSRTYEGSTLLAGSRSTVVREIRRFRATLSQG